MSFTFYLREGEKLCSMTKELFEKYLRQGDGIVFRKTGPSPTKKLLPEYWSNEKGIVCKQVMRNMELYDITADKEQFLYTWISGLRAHSPQKRIDAIELIYELQIDVIMIEIRKELVRKLPPGEVPQQIQAGFVINCFNRNEICFPFGGRRLLNVSY